MKTIASLVIVLATAVALTGCGRSTDTKAKSAKTVSKGAAKAAPDDQKTAAPEEVTPSGLAAEAKGYSVVGVVKEIDMAEGTVSLEHEAVASLNWPATTRTFALRGALISQLQDGQKVEFEFVQRNGENVVTALK